MHSLPHPYSVPTATLPPATVSPDTCDSNDGAPDESFNGFPHDMEDIGLNAGELQAKYAETGGEHDFHSRADWAAEVAGTGSKLDYWDWVLTAIAIDDENY